MRRLVEMTFMATLVCSIWATTSGAAQVHELNSTPLCQPGQLTISAGGYYGNTGGEQPQPVWSVTQSIRILNVGSRCRFVGEPMIEPVGVMARTSKALSARAPGPLSSDWTLRHGQSVYTSLGWTTPTYKDSSLFKRWPTLCAPARATGFRFSIVPGTSLVDRLVKDALPQVCASGRRNLVVTRITRAVPGPVTVHF